MKGRAILACACALTLLLGACSSSPPKEASFPAASASVTIKMFTFKPSPLAVKVGQAVKWMNQDEILHTATSGAPGSPAGVFDGTMDGRGQSFSFIFDEPGSYPYLCNRHHWMRGEIVASA